MKSTAAFALSLCGLFISGASLAHAHLQDSTPADNARLTEPPKTLQLHFSEAAQLAVLKLVSDGREVAVPVDKGAKPSERLTIMLPALAPGPYTVQWTAVAADDGHITKGMFKFTIAP